jgi:hypothetical protein
VQAGDFDSELLHLGCRMQVKVIGVLKPFLAFASSFQIRHVQNMLVFILDPHFKNPQLIRDYVDLQLAEQL